MKNYLVIGSVILGFILSLAISIMLNNWGISTVFVIGVGAAVVITMAKDYEKLLIISSILLLGFNIKLPVTLPIGSIFLLDINIIIILIIIFTRLSLKEIINKNDVFKIFLFILVYSILFSTDLANSLKGLVLWVRILIIYTYFAKTYDSKKYNKSVYLSMLVLLTSQLIISLIQKVIGGSIGLSVLGEDDVVFRGARVGYEAGISGTMGHPSVLGYFALIVFVLIVFNNNSVSQIIRKSLIVVSLIIIVLSASRTVISLSVLSIAYYTFFVMKKKKRIRKRFVFKISLIMLVFFSLTIIFGDVVYVVVGRFTNSNISEMLTARAVHIEVAYQTFMNRPIIGWGYNNYISAANSIYNYDLIKDNNYKFALTERVHNVYLLFITELGIVGTFYYFIRLYLLRLIKLISSLKRICINRGMAHGNIIVILCYLLYGIQGQANMVKSNLLIIWMGFALYDNAVTAVKKEEKSNENNAYS